MKRRFVTFFLLFMAGLSVGYGLGFLDRKSDIVTVERAEMFRVPLPDGSFLYLSYADIERERMELKHLQRRLALIENERASAWLSSGQQGPSAEGAATSSPSNQEERDAGEPASKGREDSKKKLGELFARIFSKPVMHEILRSQVQRQVGELSAVLQLSDEQRRALEQDLTRRRQARMANRPGTPPERSRGSTAQEESIEETYRTIFSPEQYHRYEEYQAGKSAVARRPQVEKDLFELAWRLRMNEEQETRAREILKVQQERLQGLSAPAGPQGDAFSVDPIEGYLRQRRAVDAETAEKMKTVLDQAQYKEYLEYLREKDSETRLIEKMIETEPHAEEGMPSL